MAGKVSIGYVFSKSSELPNAILSSLCFTCFRTSTARANSLRLLLIMESSLVCMRSGCSAKVALARYSTPGRLTFPLSVNQVIQ
eukprot:5568326-Prymnesium_polylepis.1